MDKKGGKTASVEADEDEAMVKKCTALGYENQKGDWDSDDKSPGKKLLATYYQETSDSHDDTLIKLLEDLQDGAPEAKKKAVADAPDVIKAIVGKFSKTSGNKVKEVLDELIIKDWRKTPLGSNFKQPDGYIEHIIAAQIDERLFSDGDQRCSSTLIAGEALWTPPVSGGRRRRKRKTKRKTKRKKRKTKRKKSKRRKSRKSKKTKRRRRRRK